MSDNEYEGSGHFVGDSAESIPKAAPVSKKTKLADRKIEQESAEIASEPDYTATGQNAAKLSKGLGTPTPPIGEVAGGVVDQAGLFAKEHPIATGVGLGAAGAAGAGGLYGAWKALNSGQPEAPKWDRTIAGRPQTTPQPVAEAAPVAKPAPAGPVPAPTYPVGGQQQPAIAGYGERTINAPEGVPSPIAPAAAEPVISAKDQATIDLANAKREAVLADIKRKDELHAKTMATKVKSDVAKEQKNQGAAGRPGSQQEAEKQMVKSSIVAEEDKAASAALKAESKKVPNAVAPQPLPTTGTLTTGSGMAAHAGKGPAEGKLRSEFASIGEVPEGLAFVPGGQQMDALRNSIGQENFTKLIKEKGRYPINYDEALDWTREFAGKEGAPMGRAERIAKGLPPPEGTPGIAKTVNKKKLVKVGGIGGALIAATDIANAASKGKYGEAADIATDIFVPPFAGSREAGMSRAEEEAIIKKRLAEAQKLGSPYRSVPPPKR